MAPATQCETHEFVVKTPRADKTTREELQKMIEEFAKHAHAKGIQRGIDTATIVLGGTREEIKPCKVIYHDVTPSDL